MTQAPIQVLCVDDDEDSFVLIREFLNDIPHQSYDVEWVGNYKAGLQAVRGQQHDVCFLDYHLGAGTGLDILREADVGPCAAPVILLTGSGGHNIDVEAMNSGATDYLCKDNLGAAMLERSIRYALERQRTARERMRAEEGERQVQKLEAIARLAGGVAHEFNNLMTGIVGITDMLIEDCPPNSPGAADLAMIQELVSRGAGLTEQLLDFSRNRELQVVEMDLVEALDGLESLLTELLRDRSIELHVALDSASGRVCVDPSALQQALMNLALTCREAMPDGGRLSLEGSSLDLQQPQHGTNAMIPAGAYVVLRLTDSGNGMDAVTRDQLFEPFQTTEQLSDSVGLSLATAHGIVTQSGGQIEVESEPGQGTRFTVYLPRTSPGH